MSTGSGSIQDGSLYFHLVAGFGKSTGVTAKSRNALFYLDFFELAQSGGSEQNSVSSALEPLYEGTFFKL